MVSKTSRILGIVVAVAAILIGASSARAEIGVVLQDSFGKTGWIHPKGQASVYLSNLCLGSTSSRSTGFHLCTDEEHREGRSGVVIDRLVEGKWVTLPFNEAMHGSSTWAGAPLVATPATLESVRRSTGVDLQGGSETNRTSWERAAGRSAIRDARVISLPSSREEDLRVLRWLNAKVLESSSEAKGPAGAGLVNELFKVAKGEGFDGRGRAEEYFLLTAKSVAAEVVAFAKRNGIPHQVRSYGQIPGQFRKSMWPKSLGLESYTNQALGLGVKAAAGSYGGYALTAFKLARTHLGFNIPLVFRPALNARREERRNGSTELIALRDSLKLAEKAGNDSEVSELKRRTKTLQDETFGSKRCWSDQRKRFDILRTLALRDGVLTDAQARSLKARKWFMRLISSVPIIGPDRAAGNVLSQLSEQGAHVVEGEDGLLLSLDGKEGGLTRANLRQHDPVLGFLIMAVVVRHKLEVRSVPQRVMDFDSDWNLMLQLADAAGVLVDPASRKGLAQCVAESKIAPTIASAEEPEAELCLPSQGASLSE